MTPTITKIVLVEHDSSIVELIQYELKKSNSLFIMKVVTTETAYEKVLLDFEPDIILSNYTLPFFNGNTAFSIRQKQASRIPFIFVSEAIGEEKAIELLKEGATDFVLKDRISTLAIKISRALREAEISKFKEKKNQELRDMTDYKETEQKLAATYNELQLVLKTKNKILDASLDVICSFDEEGRFVHVNAASQCIWGYQPEELIGKKYIDLVFHEDAEITLKTDTKIKSGLSETMFENRYIHKDGRIIPMLWSSTWDDDTQLSYCIAKDATEKKKLEKALETERQRFMNLYLQSPSCMGILKGANYVYEMANPLYLQLINKKDIIGKTVKEVLPELEDQGIFKFLDTVYQTGETFSANEMLVQFDFLGNGELVDTYLNFIYQAHRNEDGVIDGILFFAIDVTEQVLSRKKIEENEKKYWEIIQDLPVATYSCDTQGRIVIYNKAAVALWGRTPELGKDSWYGFGKIFNQEGLPLPFDSCPMALAIKEGKAITNEEVILERPNGDRLTILPYSVPIFDALGKVTGAVNMLMDVTELKKAGRALKESEKKYRQIVETAQEGIWLIDETNKTTFVNSKMAEILGYSRDEIMNQSIYFFMDDKGKQMIDQLMLQKEEKITRQRRFKFISKSGKEVWARVTANPLFDEADIYKGSLAMVTDITESKIAEENLIQSEKRLIESEAELILKNIQLHKTNIELNRFVYSVSHDLRSPLTSVLGLISFIEEESQEADTLEHVRMIRNSINRLDEFIKNILSYSRNNRTGLEVVKIPIQQTALAVVDALHKIKKAKGIYFEVDIRETEPFYSDRLRFNTLLENLVSNAIKYHTKDKTNRYIKITGHSNLEQLELTIADNGIGIASEYHEKIFEMFFRLSGKTEGSGIGLYIVKDTIEILQGSIQIQSEEGIGTTFIITLKNLKP